jgi:hypothetical protein
MSRELTAIHMRNLAHVERHDTMIAATHLRMQEISLAYTKALEQELKVIQESTITEDTFVEEMIYSSQAHRDRIKGMTAIPPLRPGVQLRKRKQKISKRNFKLFKYLVRKEI